MIVEVELAVLEPVTFKNARPIFARAFEARLNFRYAASSAVVVSDRAISAVVAVPKLLVGLACETYASAVDVKFTSVCTADPDGIVSSVTLDAGCVYVTCLFAGTVKYCDTAPICAPRPLRRR